MFLQDLYLCLLRKVREHVLSMIMAMEKTCDLSALQGSLESIKHLLVGRPDKDLVKGCE